MNTSFQQNPHRGSVLLYVLAFVVVAGACIYGLLGISIARATTISSLASESAERVLEQSLRAAADGAIRDSVQGGDYTQSPSAFSSLAEASVTNSGDWAVTAGSELLSGGPTALFAKTNQPAPPWGVSTASGYGMVNFAFEGTLTASATVASGGTTPFSRTFTASMPWLEIPSIEFQLVTTTSAYDADNSSPVIVTGKALFNAGLLRTQVTTLTVGAFSIVALGQPATSAGLNEIQGAAHCASWGMTDLTGLLSSTGGGYTAVQSYAQMAANLPTGRVLDWSDPATAPTGVPAAGIAVQTYNGQSRLVIDLSTYFQDSAVYIHCSTPATQSAGIVVLGVLGGITTPLVIATDGTLTIAGNNSRPVILATSYSGGGTIFSAAYAGGVPGVATPTTFTGYWVMPTTNLALSAPEDWSAATYTLSGTLLFELNVGAPLTIQPDATLESAFVNGPVSSDRFFVLTP